MGNSVVWVLLVGILALLAVIAVLLIRLARPEGKPEPKAEADDALEIAVTPALRFDGVDPSLAGRIREAINAMGAVGDDAEAIYQAALERLRPDSAPVVAAIRAEFAALPVERHLDRWSLFQLLAELRDPSALPVLDDQLSKDLPPERSKNPHRRSTLRQETINLTTAIEAIARIAADGVAEAPPLLLKHATHPSLSVRRAAAQGFLEHGGEAARRTLIETLPQSDHPLLDIRRNDVREIKPLVGAGVTRPGDPPTVADAPRVPPRRNR